jgi:phage tail protein X
MKHRRVAALLAALSASALVFVFAPTAPAQDQDVCADFNSQEDAQAVLDADPGLAQRQPLIDVDMDGIACEDLPSRGAPVDVCADFNSQEDAQAVLDADPGLAQRQPLFDVDMDGIACEDLPSRGAPATPTRGVPKLTG